MRVFSLGGHTKHRREWNTRTVPGLERKKKRKYVARPVETMSLREMGPKLKLPINGQFQLGTHFT